MKLVSALIATLFAATAFAQAPAAKKEEAKPATPAATASAPAKKEEKKAVNATKSAAPAPAAKDQKAEAPKK
jgi:hypothetical protein